jgi:hypothetical protein
VIFLSDHGEMNMEHRQWLKVCLCLGACLVCRSMGHGAPPVAEGGRRA